MFRQTFKPNLIHGNKLSRISSYINQINDTKGLEQENNQSKPIDRIIPLLSFNPRNVIPLNPNELTNKGDYLFRIVRACNLKNLIEIRLIIEEVKLLHNPDQLFNPETYNLIISTLIQLLSDEPLDLLVDVLSLIPNHDLILNTHNLKQVIYLFCKRHVDIHKNDDEPGLDRVLSFTLSSNPAKYEAYEKGVKEEMNHFLNMELALHYFSNTKKHNVKTDHVFYYLLYAISKTPFSPLSKKNWFHVGTHLFKEHCLHNKNSTSDILSKIYHCHIQIIAVVFSHINAYMFWNKKVRICPLRSSQMLTDGLIRALALVKKETEIYRFIINLLENTYKFENLATQLGYQDLRIMSFYTLRKAILILLNTEYDLALSLITNDVVFDYAFPESKFDYDLDLILPTLCSSNACELSYTIFIKTKSTLTPQLFDYYLGHFVKIKKLNSVLTLLKLTKSCNFIQDPNIKDSLLLFKSWSGLFDCLSVLFYSVHQRIARLIGHFLIENGTSDEAYKLICLFKDHERLDEEFLDLIYDYHVRNHATLKAGYDYYNLLLQLMIKYHKYDVKLVIDNVIQAKIPEAFKLYEMVSNYYLYRLRSRKINKVEYEALSKKLSLIYRVKEHHHITSYSDKPKEIDDEFMINQEASIGTDYKTCLYNLDLLLQLKVKPNLSSISNTIFRLTASRQYQDALIVFDRYKPLLDEYSIQHGWRKACSLSYSNAIRSHCGLSDIVKANELLCVMERNDCYMDSMACANYIMAIKPYPDQIAKLGSQMLIKLRKKHIKIHDFFVSVYCEAIIDVGFYQFNEFYIFCKDLGIHFSAISFAGFIKGFIYYKKWLLVEQVYDNFFKAPIKKETAQSLFNQMLALYLYENKSKDKFYRCWDMMTSNSIMPSKYAYSMLMDSYFNFKPVNVEKALKLFEDLKSRNLLNTHFVNTFVNQLRQVNEHLLASQLCVDEFRLK